jgi:hypothetical protein
MGKQQQNQTKALMLMFHETMSLLIQTVNTLHLHLQQEALSRRSSIVFTRLFRVFSYPALKGVIISLKR